MGITEYDYVDVDADETFFVWRCKFCKEEECGIIKRVYKIPQVTRCMGCNKNGLYLVEQRIGEDEDEFD